MAGLVVLMGSSRPGAVRMGTAVIPQTRTGPEVDHFANVDVDDLYRTRPSRERLEQPREQRKLITRLPLGDF